MMNRYRSDNGYHNINYSVWW